MISNQRPTSVSKYVSYFGFSEYFLFQNLCGTEPHPVRFRAKKYKIQEKSFSLADFKQMMNHLPEPVDDQEIMEMFNYADKDRDGRINFEEFLVMITPVKVPDAPIIYAKSKQPNNNNENNILATGIPNKNDPASMATKTQDISHVDKTNMTKGRISPPPQAPEEPITSEKSSTQEIRAANTTITTQIMIATTTVTTTTTANTTSDNIPVATLVTTA